MPPDKDGSGRSRAADKFSVLRNHVVFRDLEPSAVDQLCRRARLMKLRRGATVFLKGDPGASLLAVVSGTVRMSSSSAEGRNVFSPGI